MFTSEASATPVGGFRDRNVGEIQKNVAFTSYYCSWLLLIASYYFPYILVEILNKYIIV